MVDQNGEDVMLLVMNGCWVIGTLSSHYFSAVLIVCHYHGDNVRIMVYGTATICSGLVTIRYNKGNDW